MWDDDVESPAAPVRDTDPATLRATQLAPTLIGLTREEAQRRVAAADGLRIRFGADGRPVRASFGVGRITAFLKDDHVFRADAG